MNIEIKRISSHSKKELMDKIKNKDFSFDKNDKFQAAILPDEETGLHEIISKTDEYFESNKDKDYFTDSNFIFYSGPKQEKICFLFPGQGSQYINMGKEIKKIFSSNIFEKGDEIFSEINPDCEKLTQIIFPDESKDPKEAELRLQKTDAAQPGIGITSALYLSLLNELNIFPDAAAGHSFGEISALYSGGAMDFATFMKIGSTRGRLMAHCGKDKDAGSMMAVLGTIEKIQDVIKEEGLDLILANKNSPKQNVVSGPTKEIEKALKIFRKHKMRGIKLPVAAAFHSPLVEDAAIPFSKFIGEIQIKNPKIPVTSNTTGTFHGNGSIKELLSKQLTSPVCFTDNLRTLFDSGIRVFIEVGPKKVLTDLARQSSSKNENFFFAGVDESLGKSPLKDMAKVLALLSLLGFDPDLEKWNKI